MQEQFVVAIDGPAGAGKSTVAKILAKKLGYIYIDTGAMYRSVAWKVVSTGRELTQSAAEQAAREIEIVFRLSAKGENTVWVDGCEVSEAIRTPQVTAVSSRVASYPGVRAVLSDKQRAMGADGGVVMDGRDIGTCIFPNAKYKFFLTAGVEVRALRRCKELAAKGYECDQAAIAKEIAERDYADSHREIAPLRQAADAILVDSSLLDIEATAAVLYNICLGDGHAI